MAAPPWRRALPAHYDIQHNDHTTINNNTSSVTKNQSLFHNKDVLRAYAQEIHITLRKSIGTRTPIYFNIELHNGIPTITYYVRNVKDPLTHKTIDTSRTHTDTSSTNSLSSNNTASTYDISTSNTKKKVASHLSKNIHTSSHTNLPQTDITHSHHSTIITIDESLRSTHIRISSCGEPTEIAS